MASLYAPVGIIPMTQGNDPNAYLTFLTDKLGVGPSTTTRALYDTTTASVSLNVPSSDPSSSSGSGAGYVSTDLLSWLFGSDGGDGK